MKTIKSGMMSGCEAAPFERGVLSTPRRASWVRPPASLAEPPPKNLEQALQRLKAQQPAHPYAAHVASALNRMADVIGKPLARISTEPIPLRQMMAEALPASVGMGQRRWLRICSLVNTYLRTTGIELEPNRSIVSRSPAWQDLQSRASKSDALATSRFASFCTRHGVEPNDVTPGTFEAFGQAMRARSLRENPEAIVRNTIRHWNRAAAKTEGWPQLEIQQQRHARFYSLPWDAYPESFRKDVDAYLSVQSNVSVFSREYRTPIAPSTLALRLRQFRLCAALLVESGFPAEQLTSLDILVRPENVEAALQRHVDRKDGQTGHSLVQLANLLAGVGERRLEDAAQAKLLRIYANNLAMSRVKQRGRTGMTKRNREALRQFDVAGNRKALLMLPDRVFAEGSQQTTPTAAQARRVMLAMAVELLLASALRGANLVALEVERHFSDIRQGRVVVRHLVIPAAEMKGNEDFEMPLPDRTRDMLDEYLAIYWPVLAPEGSPFLFPGKAGRGRDKIHFAEAVSSFILRETGLKMHLHLFRHLAVKLHLDSHPDDIETPRRFLQHKSSKTTLTHYAEVRSERAFATHHQTLADQRKRGGERHAARG